ncbi:6-hydroxymethylpterin diphosphokinase MptE-like protein [Paenibacillus sp. R14(2021)]|uniref:motility associated factor glycosyltransferase family protein n=1 Tax=Paenibacillus sp. R14(2021) TaxID=2859228 RepID=UPI001C6124C4|nr:6-hydroxymethylpterin diphosphokinase MptE-like protein [Paenibacillus sp. R14(2021)]
MDQLEFRTEEVIEEIKLFLPKLSSACETIAKLLYRPMTEDAWQQFGDVVEGIDDLYRTLQAMHGDIVQTGRLRSLLPGIERTISDLSDKFQAMNQCVDEEDFVAASDYLQYELIEIVERLAAQLGETQHVRNERFVRNMAYLKERFPQVYGQLSTVTRDSENYQVIYTKNKQPNLYMAGEYATYLYSQYDPIHETRCWAKSMASDERKDNLILFGFGFGFHVQAYAEIYPGHRLYIYEPDEQVMLAAMEVIELSEIISKSGVKEIVVGRTKLDRDNFIYGFLRYLKAGADTLSLPVYDRIKEQEKSEFFTDARTAIINYDSSFIMYKKYGLQWVTNYMNNLAKTLESPSIEGLQGKMEGMTAIVAGAGPSLEADIECLKKLKPHAIIIAAGSTTQSLLHYGIEPHLIVSIDGDPINNNVFKNLDIAGIPFMFSPMLYHEILDARIDNLIHLFFTSDITNKYIFDLGEPYPFFKPTDSVTGTAIQAAIYMGCKEIVFTGQDFSYPGTSMYAPGAAHFTQEYSDSVLEKAIYFVENVRGTVNRTNDAMKVTLAGIENLIETFPQIRFTNATQMGAKIKYTTWEALDDVYERLKNVHPEDDFFFKAVSNLQPYDEQKVTLIQNRTADLHEKLLLNEQKLKFLDESIKKIVDLSRVNPKKCLKLMAEFDEEWRSVIHSGPFKALYLKVYRNEILEMERDLPSIVQENNLIKRAERTRDAVGPLIRTFLAGSPALIEIVKESLRRIHHQEPSLSMSTSDT